MGGSMEDVLGRVTRTRAESRARRLRLRSALLASAASAVRRHAEAGRGGGGAGAGCLGGAGAYAGDDGETVHSAVVPAPAVPHPCPTPVRVTAESATSSNGGLKLVASHGGLKIRPSPCALRPFSLGCSPGPRARKAVSCLWRGLVAAPAGTRSSIPLPPPRPAVPWPALVWPQEGAGPAHAHSA